MSRTTRRTKDMKDDIKWILREWNWAGLGKGNFITRIDPKSKEGILKLVKYHSDSGTHACKEPGPAYWRNLVTERPQRRDSKNQLRKFILDESFEVILREMDRLDYWT